MRLEKILEQMKEVIPQEFIAYHSGHPNQRNLISSECAFQGYKRYNHVFFSLDLKEEIFKEIIKRIDNWLDAYTISFKLEDIEKYHSENLTFVLIPSPVKVLY